MTSAIHTDSNLTVALRIQLGRLAVAGDATPGICHVQDKLTGKIVPVVVQPSLLPRLKNADLWSSWLRLPAWVKAMAGVAVAGLVGAVLLAGQDAWRRPNHAELPLAKAPLAITESAAAYQPVDDQQAAGPQAAGAVTSTTHGPDVVLPPKGPSASGPVVVAAPETVSMPRNLPPPKPEVKPAPAPAAAPATATTAAPAKPNPAPLPMQPTPQAALKPVQPPAPVLAPVPAKPTAVAEKAAPAAPQTSQKAEPAPAVIFNEAATDSKPGSPTGGIPAGAPPRMAGTAPQPTAQKPAAAEPNVRIRLVAIKDANTVLVNVPGIALPQQVKPGVALPNGRTIVKVDPAKGMVQFDNGAVLSLE